MKKKIVAVSGTPGVGKSTLAELLAKKLKLEKLELHHYYKEISSGYNRSKQCYDIDLKKLEKLVQEKVKSSQKGIIVDSHIAHLLPKKMVNLCVILVCSDLKKLKKRLKKRGYSQKKVRENLDAEIFQVCLVEAKERKHKVLVFDTAKLKGKEIVKKI